MLRVKFSIEHSIRKLRKAEVWLAQGQTSKNLYRK